MLRYSDGTEQVYVFRPRWENCGRSAWQFFIQAFNYRNHRRYHVCCLCHRCQNLSRQRRLQQLLKLYECRMQRHISYLVRCTAVTGDTYLTLISIYTWDPPPTWTPGPLLRDILRSARYFPAKLYV